MCADILVRKMQQSDLARVNEIDNLLFGRERLPTWPFPFDVYWREYSPDVSFVAEIEGLVVGFIVGSLVVEEHSYSVVALRHSQDGPRPYVEVGWIDVIGVDPHSQHSGIGKALVEAFCAECGARRVVVRGIAVENDLRLRRFLEAVGFKARELIVYEKGGQAQTD